MFPPKIQRLKNSDDIEKILPKTATDDIEETQSNFPFWEILIIFLLILCISIPIIYLDVMFRTNLRV